MNADTTSAKLRRGRVENAARRRAQIIEATTASIVRHGLAGTTLATVADEAGLSQGVMVFYFKTKQALLAETLRWHYEEYRTIWQAALDRAGTDPVDRIVALARADFDPRVCNHNMLILWHAFWGESSARPLFASIADQFDSERSDMLTELCKTAEPFMQTEIWRSDQLAVSIDSLTDGLWHGMHLSPGWMTTASAMEISLRFVASAFPARTQQILASIR